MKKLFACAAILLAAIVVFAQAPAPKAPPKSPAARAEGKIGPATISIDYSSPRVNGREGKIFPADGLIRHDSTYPIWRAGANAATTLTTDADITIGNLAVPKGTYTLYVDISNPSSWVLIVNKQTGQWGTKYDKTQDLGRVPLSTGKSPALVEDLVYSVVAHGKHKGTLTLAGEDVTASAAVAAAK